MSLKTIVSANRDNIAFVVGNGINRFPNNPDAISWENLLLKLWMRFAPNVLKSEEMPKGLTLTEFYDILDLSNSEQESSDFSIQKKAAEFLEDWSFKPHHKLFIDAAKQINAPVLTANFDLILPHSNDLIQFRISDDGFTDFYPWSTYYSDNQLENPADGFGIWFINGFVKYHRSIRLGLTHYMGSVDRARNMLHKGDANPFGGKNQEDWKGRNTWLHIIFNKPLCIFGLSLDENEVFLRWLLIERAKYFKKFPDRSMTGWYVAAKSDKNNTNIKGKTMFMNSVGLEFVEVEDYNAIYESPWHDLLP